MNALKRREVVAALLRDRPPNLAAVSSLGSATWDLADASDAHKDFHFIGAMGQAAPFAFGLSLAQPHHRVLLFAGDGEMLMGLGMLATVANHARENLAIVVLDNESYVETGDQPTATSGRTDLEAVARSCGFDATATVREQADMARLTTLARDTPGPVFAVAKVAREKLPLRFPPSFDGATAMNRFRDAILR